VDSPAAPKPLERVIGAESRVTVINHATVLIQSAGYNILTDPIFSKRCSPFSFIGPKRVRAPAIAFEDLPKIDVVLISHDHYDHLDLPTLKRLIARDNPQILVGLRVGQYIKSLRFRELDWWESAAPAPDLKVTFVPVQHFSGRGLFDRFKTLWGGFVIEVGKKKIYFGGDSGYANHYVQTFEKFGPMDIAMLPIGAYRPRDFMRYVHVDPAEAVKAHQDLHAQKSVAIHYGTFQLSAEPLNEPQMLLRQAVENAGLDSGAFVAPAFGTPVIF
jgi:L-ascorbate metabolism protein UlaG (beta-lactamase superfamily)